MKKYGWLMMAAYVLSGAAGTAQERRLQDIVFPVPSGNGYEPEYTLPDSMIVWSLDPSERSKTETISIRSAVPMTSVAVILREHLPVRTMILRNNTLRIGRYLILSNGQAENWGPYPSGYLDARTISLPLP